MPSLSYAIRLRSQNGWDLGPERIETPGRLKADQALIAGKYVGLCGSDLHAIYGDQGYDWVRLPVTLGHEIVGTVVEVGPGCDTSLLGKAVAIVAIEGCGSCIYCREGRGNYCGDRTCQGLHFDGGLAEYFLTNSSRLHVLDNLTPEPVDALHEPLAIIFSMLDQAKLSFTEKLVAVTGPGSIGILSSLVLRSLGADVELIGLPEKDSARLKIAQDLGIRTSSVPEKEVDIWIESSGAESALNLAITMLKSRGNLLVPGLYSSSPKVDMNRIVRRGLQMTGTYGYLRQHFQMASEFIKEYGSSLERLISLYSFQEAVRAFKDSSHSAVVKAIVKV